MEEVKRFVGIDVAKAALDVFMGSAGAAFSVANDEAGIRQLLRQLKPADFVILEATGGLEVPVASGLATAGIAAAAGAPRLGQRLLPLVKGRELVALVVPDMEGTLLCAGVSGVTKTRIERATSRIKLTSSRMLVSPPQTASDESHTGGRACTDVHIFFTSVEGKSIRLWPAHSTIQTPQYCQSRLVGDCYSAALLKGFARAADRAGESSFPYDNAGSIAYFRQCSRYSPS
jgi:hypothetical protein